MQPTRNGQSPKGGNNQEHECNNPCHRECERNQSKKRTSSPDQGLLQHCGWPSVKDSSEPSRTKRATGPREGRSNHQQHGDAPIRSGDATHLRLQRESLGGQTLHARASQPATGPAKRQLDRPQATQRGEHRMNRCTQRSRPLSNALTTHLQLQAESNKSHHFSPRNQLRAHKNQQGHHTRKVGLAGDSENHRHAPLARTEHRRSHLSANSPTSENHRAQSGREATACEC